MSSKPTFACTRCAERKVKCDRKRPCSACMNHKVDCVFQPPRPPQKRHRQIKNQILTDRLQYYETLLQEQGIDPSKLPDTPGSDPRRRPSQTVAVAEVPKELQLQTQSSIESEASGSVSKTQVIHGQGRSMFVDK